MSLLTPASGQRSALQNTGLYLLAGLIALGPLNSKLLGLAWLCFWVFGMYVAFRARHTNAPANSIAAVTSSIWFKSCMLALILGLISNLIWHEGIDSLNPQLRLALAAAAALCLARHGAISADVRSKMLDAVALACAFAFALTIYLTAQGSNVDVRASLATNAIPWAVVISFYTCLLLPAALSEAHSIIRRRLWLFCVGCGIAAILLSQSRGAFLIIPWCCLVYAWFWYRSYGRDGGFHRALLMLLGAVTVVLASSWFLPGDILRMHRAVQDIEEAQASENYNTSMGARLYLWGMAVDGIRESPWIGIGSVERMRRIKHAGDGETSEQVAKLQEVRALGHVHNQYLHSALDGGLIGLAAFLASLTGMAIAIFYLRRAAPIAAWQMGGVLFMHATSNLSNVNFAHNYYATGLALAVVLPLLSSAHEATETRKP